MLKYVPTDEIISSSMILRKLRHLCSANLRPLHCSVWGGVKNANSLSYLTERTVQKATAGFSRALRACSCSVLKGMCAQGLRKSKYSLMKVGHGASTPSAL